MLQGANYENLRRETAAFLGSMDFDGYGIGGAIEKKQLGEIVRWVNEELPANKPKHMLGISEPDDMFEAVAMGVDTFDVYRQHEWAVTARSTRCLAARILKQPYTAKTSAH